MENFKIDNLENYIFSLDDPKLSNKETQIIESKTANVPPLKIEKIIKNTEAASEKEIISSFASGSAEHPHLAKKEENKKIITKTTIQRLVKDVRDLLKSPLNDNGIYYSHDEENILKGYALIVGPSETPYFGGFYFFEFNFPEDYPFSPPTVIFSTNGDNIRFNPNLYKCGRVCVSILNTWSGDQWSSCQSITTVLLSLCSLFCKNPLLNEPGVNPSAPELQKYNKIIEYKNIDIAIIKMITKSTDTYSDKFDVLFPFVEENFIKNKKNVLDFLKEKAKKIPEKVITSIYNMNVNINYDKLLKEYMNIYSKYEDSDIKDSDIKESKNK